MHKFAQQLQNDHEESDRKQNLKGKQILNKKGNFILTKNKFSVEITYEIKSYNYQTLLWILDMESFKKVYFYLFLYITNTICRHDECIKLQ